MSLRTVDKLTRAHFSEEFPSGTDIETITNATGNTTYREMQADLPEGATLVKADLLAFIYATNLGTNDFAINLSLQFRKGTEAPTAIFAASPGFSVPATQYSITPWVGVFDVSSVVDDPSAEYSARFNLTGVGVVNDVRCLTGYILRLYYKMG